MLCQHPAPKGERRQRCKACQRLVGACCLYADGRCRQHHTMGPDAVSVWAARQKSEQSGYVTCDCRDCMEIAIGVPGALCHACDDAGCDPERECLVCARDDEACAAEMVRRMCKCPGACLVHPHGGVTLCTRCEETPRASGLDTCEGCLPFVVQRYRVYAIRHAGESVPVMVMASPTDVLCYMELATSTYGATLARVEVKPMTQAQCDVYFRDGWQS